MTENYIGNELDLFTHAVNWKKYWSSEITKYLGTNVIEVGAGIGGTTLQLMHPGIKSWICIEPDKSLLDKIAEKVKAKQLPSNIELVHGTLANVPETRKADSILYIDVIEHIEHVKPELANAVNHLERGGHIIIVVPAHNFLFSEFDKAIGHFRRYDRNVLKAELPAGVKVIKSKYLDSFGLFASLANKMLLSQKYPTPGQIKFWDNLIVPVSKITDKLTFNRFGKSMVVVLQKQ